MGNGTKRCIISGFLFPIPYFTFPICYLFLEMGNWEWEMELNAALFPIPYSLFPISYSLFPIPLSSAKFNLSTLTDAGPNNPNNGFRVCCSTISLTCFSSSLRYAATR